MSRHRIAEAAMAGHCRIVVMLAITLSAALTAAAQTSAPAEKAVAKPSAASVPAAAHKAGEIVLEPTTVVMSGVGRTEYELGTLYVPENRSDPKSRIIGVGFARFKATGTAGGPPIFQLPGGPGSSYLSSLRGGAGHIMLYRQAGDMILVDQRGASDRGDVIKYSYRTADEPLDQPASIERETATFMKVSKDAVDALTKKGFDLRGYTVKECAEDVNDLRKALGYDKINLVGVSFGSQWSFAIMRLHPEIVARAVLAGVEPLDNGYDMPSCVMEDTRRFWNEAESFKPLEPYIPPGGIEAAAKAVFKRLEASPIKVQVKDPKSGQMVTITLGKEDLQRDFWHNAKDGPAFVLSLYHEHYESWAQSVLAKRQSHPNDLKLLGPLIDSSLGVTPGREKELRSDGACEFLGQWNWNASIASKEIWPSADMGDDFRSPVKTDIPVIFMHGDWDVSTPLQNAVEIAKSFPKGKLIVIERGEHGARGPFANSCPKEWEKVLDFLRTGVMPELPERVKVPAPRFDVPDFPPPGK